MSRQIARSSKMEKRIQLRVTEADIAALKLESMKRGLDMSGLIRSVLIQQKILDPLG